MEYNTDNAQILIVDDTQKNIQVLGTLLKQKGYKIYVARDGLQAMETIKRVKPDLILLDVMMPNLDGFETCKRIMADESQRDTPILFLTARVESEDILKGFEAGAVDYVLKPFNTAELLARVNSHLQLKFARERLATLSKKLSKYLSPQVYESIFTGKKDVKIESYRRNLTVFFSDIVSFTPIAETMDHLSLTNWLNDYLNEMTSIVMQYSGTLDKYIGDAIMVFFGDPLSSGEQADAITCVRMALAMQAKTKMLNIDIRIGINSGECTVGNFGSVDRMEYTIIGKEVNLAARLESNSSVGNILISDSTYALIKDEIACEKRGTIRVKGIDRDIMTYWVKGDESK